MKRNDLRAIDMSDIIYEAVATLVTRPVTDDELVKMITADPDLMAKVTTTTKETQSDNNHA